MRLSPCLLVLVLTLPALAQEPAEFTGRWRGKIETIDLEVEVDLAHADGAWSGDISIPAQGAEDLPLTAFSLADGELTFQIDGVPGEPTFVGRLAQDGAALVGDFNQATAAFGFRLERHVARGDDTRAALGGLDAWLAESMQAWKVPGLGLAIVRDDEVVYLAGHGRRDVAQDLPVTPDTLFAIGSSSKAFTTTALATLVGEGRLAWNDPLVEHLPGFQLHDEFASMHLTPRDMASHRSGLPRHDLAWYNRAELVPAELVARLRHFEPSAELRETWQYNNLMFVTLGHLAATLDERPWEQVVRARVLDPLGMARTNFTVVDSQADPDHALPYDERDDELVAIPFRDISNVGPAGSINSSPREMAQWVRLQLSKGEVDGVRVLSDANLKELHGPVAVIGGLPDDPDLAPALYGMGWMIDGYHGHLRVHHGGNIDGFSALVSFFPHDGLGLVVLTNRNGTPLPEFVVRRVADLVLGDEPRDWSAKALAQAELAKEAVAEGEERSQEARAQDTTPSHPLADYAGAFEHPGYGTLAIALEEGALRMTYNDISAPLEHWHYEVFRAGEDERDPALEGMMLQFESNLAGEIAALRVPFEPSVERIRFERAPDPRLSDPAYLTRFVGAFSVMGQRVEVSLNGDSLTIAAPGQGATPLVPRWKDSFTLEGVDGVRLSFTVEEGSATEIVIRQAGRTMVAKRMEE